jgi:hypothetical protein
VSNACTVVIGAPDLLPSLKERTPAGDDEVLAFSDADALRALEVIAERRPRVVALERVFAATPRGAALINRIRADPALTDAEIRVLSHQGDYSRVLPRTGGSGGAVAPRTRATTAASAAPVDTMSAASTTLDRKGTRRAARYKMAPAVEAIVDGNVVTVVDLSTVGAQVVSVTILRPNQRVRVVLADDAGSMRLNATIAWASFEIPPAIGPRYRAGLEFTDPDATGVGAFCTRHKM